MQRRSFLARVLGIGGIAVTGAVGFSGTAVPLSKAPAPLPLPVAPVPAGLITFWNGIGDPPAGWIVVDPMTLKPVEPPVYETNYAATSVADLAGASHTHTITPNKVHQDHLHSSLYPFRLIKKL